MEHPDPEKVAGAYTVDSRWRNRAETFTGREVAAGAPPDNHPGLSEPGL